MRGDGHVFLRSVNGVWLVKQVPPEYLRLLPPETREYAPHIQHAGEPTGNADREAVVQLEPRALRTFTPTQADIAASAGVYHFTADGRRLFDFTSGVLVSNLGHNPTRWMSRFASY